MRVYYCGLWHCWKCDAIQDGGHPGHLGFLRKLEFLKKKAHESDLIRSNLTICYFFGVPLNIITIKDNTLFPGLGEGKRINFKG